jgi:hypothetical protein
MLGTKPLHKSGTVRNIDCTQFSMERVAFNHSYAGGFSVNQYINFRMTVVQWVWTCK